MFAPYFFDAVKNDHPPATMRIHQTPRFFSAFVPPVDHAASVLRKVLAFAAVFAQDERIRNPFDPQSQVGHS